MNHPSNPLAFKTLFGLGAFLLLTVSGFSQGETPRALSVKNALNPRTEIALYLDVRGAEESGFAKKAEAEYPQLMEGIEEATEEMEEFTEVTGIALEDIAELSVSLTGADELFDALQNGEEPDFGPKTSILAVARLDKPVDVRKLVNSISNKVSEEKGPEAQRMILSSLSQFRGATIFVMPPEMMKDADLPFPIAIGIRAIGKDGFLAIGKEKDVKGFFSGGNMKPGAAPYAPQVRKALPADSQMWMSMVVPEGILQEAVQELRQNPMLAGFATVIVKMREVGIALHLKKDSMGVSLASGFDETKSATQMWTLSQGLLAMAKLAASGEGADMPPFINKLTSVVKGKAVVFSTEVTIDDLDMMVGEGGGDFDDSDPAGEEEEFEFDEDAPENLKDEDAPDFKTSLLDGRDFKLSAAKGKNIVVLDFWATWCGPCVKALPEVKAATDALKSKGVVLVAVNQGERPGDIQRFLKKRNWNALNVGLDPKGEIAKKFGVQGIPQTVIIDKDGVIREVHVGYSPGMGKRLSQELLEILAD